MSCANCTTWGMRVWRRGTSPLSTCLLPTQPPSMSVTVMEGWGKVALGHTCRPELTLPQQTPPERIEALQGLCALVATHARSVDPPSTWQELVRAGELCADDSDSNIRLHALKVCGLPNAPLLYTSILSPPYYYLFIFSSLLTSYSWWRRLARHCRTTTGWRGPTIAAAASGQGYWMACCHACCRTRCPLCAPAPATVSRSSTSSALISSRLPLMLLFPTLYLSSPF